MVVGLNYETGQIKLRNANLNIRILAERRGLPLEPGTIIAQTPPELADELQRFTAQPANNVLYIAGNNHELLKLLVARDGIEPPTPAFSGPLTDSPKWFEIRDSLRLKRLCRLRFGMTDDGLGPLRAFDVRVLYAGGRTHALHSNPSPLSMDTAFFDGTLVRQLQRATMRELHEK